MADAILLAIETSCDETGVAVVERKNEVITVRAEALASQINIHAATGGVVPEIAAREHTQVIQPLIAKVMSEANVASADLTAIAVTVGPGLQPALAVGVTAAQALAYAWQKPIIPVHHLEGHIYSALPLKGEVFPVLALIVSGGHTMLVKVEKHVSYQVLGTTQDDAAGEAFDKVGRLLGLSYPGGPAVSKLAKTGNRTAFTFPRPMLDSNTDNFSFSGLKTAVVYTVRDLEKKTANISETLKADIAASFEAAVVDTLVKKTMRAAERENIATILLAGGVAANQPLRDELARLAQAQGKKILIADPKLCGDNATMIGRAGIHAFAADRKVSWADIDATARLNLADFSC